MKRGVGEMDADETMVSVTVVISDQSAFFRDYFITGMVKYSTVTLPLVLVKYAQRC